MGKHIIFVGGGHAHLTSLLNSHDFISRGHRVTLVSASSFHYYSGMGPGMLSGMYSPHEIRFNVKKMIENRGGTFIEDIIVRVNPDAHTLHLKSGNTLNFDIASFNTGSDVPIENITIDDNNVFTVKPIINLLKARKFIIELCKKKTPRIIVVGGGAAGLEIAGNAWRLVHEIKGTAEVRIIAGNKLMNRYPSKVRYLSLKSFRKRGIEVIEQDRVETIKNGMVHLKSGKEFPHDLVFLAMGIKPSKFFSDSGLPVGNDRGLLVNSYLQSVSHMDIFGGGDCISLVGHSLAKIGVYAVRENNIIYHNIMTSVQGGEMKEFHPGGSYLLIFNMGNGKGIFWKDRLVWDGRLAFKLKDRIDKRFMKKFQVSGELNKELE